MTGFGTVWVITKKDFLGWSKNTIFGKCGKPRKHWAKWEKAGVFDVFGKIVSNLR
jgi:hypothetical protein